MNHQFFNRQEELLEKLLVADKNNEIKNQPLENSSNKEEKLEKTKKESGNLKEKLKKSNKKLRKNKLFEFPEEIIDIDSEIRKMKLNSMVPVYTSKI